MNTPNDFTLRDYFAAQMLPRLFAIEMKEWQIEASNGLGDFFTLEDESGRYSSSPVAAECIAERCYYIADEMMKARAPWGVGEPPADELPEAEL